MESMSITVPQNQLRMVAKSLTAFSVTVERHRLLVTAGLITTVAKEMYLLANTQATDGLHANAINICRVQTCLENLRAAALVITEPPLEDESEHIVDEARRLLSLLHADLLTYDDELKAA